jgi:hypothetical protein
MSQGARDIIELLRDAPHSIELRRLALNIIAPGCSDQRAGG